MKNKWYLSRSFVRKKIVRASVCASFLLSRVAPPPFITAPPSCARFFSLVEEFVVATASSTDASLTLSERRRRRSSWPYATTKPILKITFEFRVCALRDEHDEGEREARMGGKITFCSIPGLTCMDHWPLKKSSRFRTRVSFLKDNRSQFGVDSLYRIENKILLYKRIVKKVNMYI